MISMKRVSTNDGSCNYCDRGAERDGRWILPYNKIIHINMGYFILRACDECFSLLISSFNSESERMLINLTNKEG